MKHIPRERDPNLINLERDVFSKMSEATAAKNPKPSVSQDTGVKHVSFEDAIKELSSLDGLESTNDKS